MDKSIKLLVAVLAMQLLLVAAVFSSRDSADAWAPDATLLSFDPAEVDRLSLQAGEGEPLILSKADNGWIMPEQWNAPVKPGKVDELLTQLSGLKKGYAVATSASARERFEVDEQRFQRRIELLQGDRRLAEVFFGSSPAMRRIHASSGDDEAVHTVAFSAWQAPAEAQDWLDSGLLHIDAKQLLGIQFDGVKLTRSQADKSDAETQNSWRAEDLAAGESLNLDQAAELARTISGLEVSKLLGTEAQTGFGQETPLLVLQLSLADGTNQSWRISKRSEGEGYVLKSSAHPWYLEPASWAGKPLVEAADRKALIESAEAEEGAGLEQE